MGMQEQQYGGDLQWLFIYLTQWIEDFFPIIIIILSFYDELTWLLNSS